LHAIDALRADGVGFVFNTPNDQSRPVPEDGVAARGAVAFHAARSIMSLISVARARVPADKWSQPTTAGLSAPRCSPIATAGGESPARVHHRCRHGDASFARVMRGATGSTRWRTA